MRTSVHRNTRLRPVAPVRRVLAVAMAFLMLMASLPMDAVASMLDQATARRVISETMPDGSVFDYEYDAFGRVARRSSPQGSVFHGYDEATGRRVHTSTASGDVSYGYDELGRLAEVVVPRLGGRDLAEPRVTEYAYDGIGARTAVRHGNGVETYYAYDELDRLVSLEHCAPGGERIASFSYAYQADGRRVSASEETPSGSSVVRYSYDALGRLLSEIRTGGAHPFSAAYAYDLNGNRLSRTVAAEGLVEATTYSYDDGDRLLSETAGGAVTRYAYDENGSLVSKTKAGEFSYNYSYNLQGRHASAQVSRLENGRTVSVSAEYSYNPQGVRTAALQTVDGVVSDRHFLLDDGLTGYMQVLEESAVPGGNPLKSYVLGDDVLAQDNCALLQDGHGSTRVLVDANGTAAESYDYDAYGRMLGGNPGISEGQTLTDILYSGEQFDPGLQMEYLRARYYDQDTGRFNRLDPFDGNYEEPQSLHKYAYCHCDPVNGTDPSGEMALLSVMSTISVMSEAFSCQLMETKVVLQGIKNIFGENYVLNMALNLIALYEYVEVAMFVIFAAVAVIELAMDLPKICRTIYKVASGIPDYIQHLKKCSRLSWKWKNVRKRLGTSGWALPGQEIHHKYIPRGGTGKLTFKGFFKEQWGRFVPDFIKNQKWNLMPIDNPELHKALHGNSQVISYNVVQRLWYGSGPVFKTEVVGLSVATAWFIDDYLNDND